MKTVTVQLLLPAQPGAKIVSRDNVQSAINAEPSFQVVVESTQVGDYSVYHDFGATALALGATAAGAALVSGLFDVFKTVIQEIFEERRQKHEQEHELRVLLLKIGTHTYEVDLTKGYSAVEAQLQERAADALAKVQ